METSVKLGKAGHFLMEEFFVFLMENRFSERISDKQKTNQRKHAFVWKCQGILYTLYIHYTMYAICIQHAHWTKLYYTEIVSWNFWWKLPDICNIYRHKIEHHLRIVSSRPTLSTWMDILSFVHMFTWKSLFVVSISIFSCRCRCRSRRFFPFCSIVSFRFKAALCLFKAIIGMWVCVCMFSMRMCNSEFDK